MAARPYKIPESVLVVIHTPEREVLLIERADAPGTWQSVTGAKDYDGEPFDATAIREVAEETGIVGRVLIELGTIDYWFAVGDRRIHKYVHHYLLEAIGGDLTIENDPDQEAIDVAWFPLQEAHRHLTFPNERRIARVAWQRLAGDT